MAAPAPVAAILTASATALVEVIATCPKVLVSAIVPAAEFRFNPPNLDSNATPPLAPVASNCIAVAEL